MPKIINTAYCKLVGLCCVKGQERDRIYREWSERFQEHDAFWLDVNENQTGRDMAKAVTAMIAQQHIGHMVNTTVVIAAFLDLTQEPDLKLLGEVIEVGPWLHKALGCNISLTAEFGYLEQLAFADKDALRTSVKQVEEVNRGKPDSLHPLYLVATSPLIMPQDDNCWKSVMVFLDVLRREPAPASLIHGGNPHGDVGFLRYGEYDEQKLNWLNSEKTRLVKALGNDGDMAFKNVINTACAGIVTEIKNKYIVDGHCHPIHPDMIVTGAIKQALAGKGKLNSYEVARNSTWTAVSMTGNHLQETILEDYSDRIRNAGADLVRYIEEAGIGVGMEKDTDRMISILTPARMTMVPPQPPALKYQKNGCAQEITNYLVSVREYAAAKTKFDYCNALCEAYKAIQTTHYDQKKAGLKEQEGQVDTRLGGLMDRSTFINMAAAGNPLPMSCFYPVLGGGNQMNWVITRTQADAVDLDSLCAGTKTMVYYIDEQSGGLKMVDNAPIKALQILLFDCDDDRLQDLI